MATNQKMQYDQSEFQDAFDNEGAEPQGISEDEEFGTEEDTATEESQAMPDQAENAEAGGDGAQGAAPAVVIAVEPGADQNAGAEDMPADPKDIQRQKSWEGRLKAREDALKAREEALKSRDASSEQVSEPGETQAQEDAEPTQIEALEDAVEAVQSGEMSYQQAMDSLSGDFGPDFARAIGILIDSRASEIAGKTADDRFGKVNKNMDELVSAIVQDKRATHEESISEAHPDFIQVAGSPEFKQFIDSMDEAKRAAAMKVIQGGSPRSVNALLDAFKAAGQAPEAKDDPAMDDAEGVRSKGLVIPEKPTGAQGYEDAWNAF